MAQKGRSRTGHLYRRWNGKDYAIDDAEAKGKGVIWLRYTLNGKRVKQSLNTTDATEARREQQKLMAPLLYANRKEALEHITFRISQDQKNLERADQAKRTPMKVEAAWDAYLKSAERPDTGEATLKYYAAYWRKFKNWLSITHPKVNELCDITSGMAQAYTATLNGGAVTPNTYNKHTAFLKLFFRVLQDGAGLKANPFEKIRRKNLKTQSRRELTIAELKEILEGATGDLQTLLYLGTFTGLRLGDCCTLTWGETDLNRGLIRRVPNKTAKSGKPVLIGIPVALHEKLAETPPKRRKGYVLARFAELYTYRNASGRPTKQPDISNEIQEHLKACGIQTIKEGTGREAYEAALEKWEQGGKKGAKPVKKRAVVEVGFHSLRHTYVSMHAEAGTPQAMIQAIVGHGSPAMTAHYTHISEETARRVAQVIDLGGAG